MTGLERELHSLKANPSACADDQNRTHRVKLSLLIRKIALGTPHAMEAKAVKRLISVTGLGAGDSRGMGDSSAVSLLLGRIYADKDAQEWIMRRSRLDWTIVRPTVLTTGPPTGAYQVLVDASDWRSGFISRAEVADFLVKQIEDASLLRKTPVLTA